MSNKTFRVFVEKIGGTESADFIGQEGDLFFDPETPQLKVSDGVTPGGVALGGGGGAVDSVNGQSGVVTLDASDVGAATAAQGALADTAVQPGDLAAVATSGDYADLANSPVLGSAAASDVSDFATAAQGALADTSIQPIDCGDIISHSVTEFATAAQGVLADSAVQPNDPEAVPSVASNKNKVLIAGVSAPSWGDIKENNALIVSRAGDDAIANGSYTRPFKTVQAAINYVKQTAINESSVQPSCGSVIILTPGQYTEDVTIDMTSSFTVTALDILAMPSVVIDSHPTKIAGQFTINGSSTTRIRLRDFQIATKTALEGGVNTDIALTITDTQGRIYLENVTVTQSISNPAVPTIRINGNFQRWIDMTRCNWNGELNLGGTPIGNPTLFVFQNNNFDGTIKIDHSSYVVRVHDCPRMGYITHNAGKLLVRGVGEIKKDGSGNSIISTADNSVANNFLAIMGVNFQGITTTPFTYGKINKTGNCPFILSNVNRDTTSDVLTGSRQNYADNAEDIKVNHAEVNYGAADSLEEHINEIDIALGLRARRVTVPLTSTSAGQTGDYAVDATYTYHCIAPSSWVRLVNDVTPW